MRLSDKAKLLVLVPLLFELIFVLTLTQLMQQAELAAQTEFRSREVVSHVNNLLRLVLESTFTITAPSSNSAAMVSKMGTVSPQAELLALKIMVKDRPEEEQIFERIEDIIAEASRTVQTTKDNLAAGNNFALISEARRLRPLIDQLSMQVDDLIEMEQQRQALSPATAAARRQQIQKLLLLGVLLNCALAIVLVIYFNRTTAARLSILMENTKRMAAAKALQPPLSGSDEIAELDTVFHEMAGSLRRADQLKQEFIAMITHDLRTPLTSVEGVLTLLGEDAYEGDAAKRKVRVQAARANIRRLLKLVNELLDLEKLNAGMVQLDLQPVNLKELLDKSVDIVFPEVQQAMIRVAVEEGIPVCIGDSERLLQVLVNLLGNARKFSPEGEPITMDCHTVENWLEISICDRGVGVPLDQCETIFERFTQASMRRDAAGKPIGTGLGLAICKSIIQAHGGSVGVKPNHPCGSVFWMRLPFSRQMELSQ